MTTIHESTRLAWQLKLHGRDERQTGNDFKLFLDKNYRFPRCKQNQHILQLKQAPPQEKGEQKSKRILSNFS